MHYYSSLVLSALLASTIISHATYHETDHTQSSKNIIIAWDIHDVLLETSWSHIIKQIVMYPHKWKAISQTHPRLWWKLVKLTWNNVIRHKGSVEEFFAVADQENPYLADWISTLSNQQEPIQETINIVRELHKKGYKQHILSNIGKTVFEHLTNPEKYPQFTSLFSYMDLKGSQIVTYHPEKTIKKPNPEFYRLYLEKNKINPERTMVIFVDDRKENVDAAEQVGMKGIWFQKDPYQLRRDLRSYQVDIEVPETEFATSTFSI